MPKQGREHATGPYKHFQRWRVVYFAANGASETVSYATEAEAIKERDAYNAAAGSRTVGEALRDYLQEKADERGIATTRYRLTAILRVKEGDRPLSALTAPLARELYRRRTEECAPDTHQGELSYVKRFCDWCCGRGWIRLNPFAGVTPVGKKGTRRDQQLRVDEAQRVLDTACAEGSLESVVVLVALLMGLRAHEVVERVVRDVDGGGRILWVTKSKTDAGVRQLVIPAMLRGPLLALCAGKGPADPLFIRGGKRTVATRDWLHYHVVRLAKKAGVPRVTPHGLRRTWMTLGVLGGVDSLAKVARDGGHADRGVTAVRHYIAPGAVDSANGARVVMLLNTPDVPDRSVSSAQNQLDGSSECAHSIDEAYETN